MRQMYYYMPPCPRCKSEVTGRYLKTPFVKKDLMMIESLSNGEIIKFAKKIPEKNAFCCTCGFAWNEDPRLVRITPEEKEAEIYRRGTEALMNKYIEDNHVVLQKKHILGGIFAGLTDFF